MCSRSMSALHLSQRLISILVKYVILAEGVGFEPTAPVRGLVFSKHARLTNIRLPSMAEATGVEPASHLSAALRFQRSGLTDAQHLQGVIWIV